MRLRLSPGNVARILRNLGYTPGRDVRLPYPVELDPTDYPLGTTMAVVTLILAPEFGQTPVLIKTITNIASAAGQITDTGADGTGFFTIDIGAAELLPYGESPLAYEVVVTDSRGLQASLDAGSFVPAASTAGKPVDHVILTPATFGLTYPQTQPMTVTAYDEDGNVLIGRAVVWQSSDPATATVDSNGVVSVVGPGTVTITATVEGHAATAIGTLIGPVDHVVVTPAAFSLMQGNTQQLTATVYDAANNVLVGHAVVWSSGNPTRAGVSATGLVTALIGGAVVTISATADSIAGTSAVTTVALTLAQFITAFNALGGTTLGMTMRVLYLAELGPTYQTIVANGGSPTGYYCTRIENALAVGDGNHLRPRADTPNGAPCTATGRLMGKGLYCPGTAPYLAAPGFRDDTTTIASVVTHVPNNLFTDRGAGFTGIHIGRLRIGSYAWRLGPVGGANSYSFAGDAINGPNFEALKDPNANVGAPLLLNQGGSSLMVCDTHVVHTQFGPGNGVIDGNFARNRYGRDLIQDVGYQIAGALYTAGRDLTILDADAFEPSADTEWIGFALGDGRMNLAQTSLLHNWTASQSWGPSLWADTRRLGFLFGDSEEDPFKAVQVDGIDHLGHIIRGFHGRPRIPNFTATLMARAGNTPDSYQMPFLRWIEDCDFINRSRVVSLQWESNNTLGDATAALQENYAWADAVRTQLGAKGKVIGYSTIYDTDQKKALLEPTVWNDLLVNGPSHYDGIINNHDALEYSAFNFGDGTTDPVTGPRAEWWVTRHPREPESQEYRLGFFACGFLLGLGEDLSAQSMKVDPSVDHTNLIVGGGTFTPTWTAKRYDGVTLGGKTFTFTSRNTGVATVDAAGVITPVGGGATAIDCWSNDGAKGAIVVIVVGPILSATFTAADSASVVPNADTGQSPVIYGGGTWGVSGNALYHPINSGVDVDAVGYAVAGLSGAYTAKIQLTVVKWNSSFLFRGVDASNFYRVQYDAGAGTEHLTVQKRIAGAWSNVGATLGVVLQNNDFLEIVGSTTSPAFTLNVRRAGAVVATANYSDAALQTGNVFGAQESQVVAGARWDNLTLTQP